jgi:hypothetical protein
MQKTAGHAEGFHQAGVLINQPENPLARQADHAVGGGFQLVQALLRLRHRGGCPRSQTAA